MRSSNNFQILCSDLIHSWIEQVIEYWLAVTSLVGVAWVIHVCVLSWELFGVMDGPLNRGAPY